MAVALIASRDAGLTSKLALLRVKIVPNRRDFLICSVGLNGQLNPYIDRHPKAGVYFSQATLFLMSRDSRQPSVSSFFNKIQPDPAEPRQPRSNAVRAVAALTQVEAGSSVPGILASLYLF